jgi:O-antigen/teichoic acid export membrane protein
MNKNDSLIKNSIYNMIYKLLNIIFPLLMSAYVSHIIYSKGVGKVVSAQNIVQYFLMIAALGIPEYGIREIAKRRECEKSRNRVFSELFWLNGISTICCIFAYIVFASYMNWFNDKLLYMIAGISIILNFINVDWVYQGEENYKFIMIRSFIVKITTLILMVILVRTENDYYFYVLANVVAVAGNYIFNIIHLRKLGVKLYFKNLDICRHLKSVFILLCTTISIELYTLLDITMLTYSCDEENVGYYAMALKIPKMIIVAVTGISGVLLPRLSRYYSENEIDKCNVIVSNALAILIFLFIPCGVGIIIVAPELMVVLFGESFLPGVATLRIASLLIYALGFSNLFGTQLLLTVGKEKQLLLSTICGATTNIVLNGILIPKYAQNGAAVASVISETLVTLMTLNFAMKNFKINLEKRGIVVCSVSCVVMTVVCCITKQMFQSSILSLLFTVVVGGSVYVGCNAIMKNPMLVLLKDIKNKERNQ